MTHVLLIACGGARAGPAGSLHLLIACGRAESTTTTVNIWDLANPKNWRKTDAWSFNEYPPGRIDDAFDVNSNGWDNQGVPQGVHR